MPSNLSPSSPIVYPPSSSPPRPLAWHKRSIEADDASNPKRRFLGQTLPLSLRDPNRLDNVVASFKKPRGLDTAPSTSSNSRLKALFVDDDEDDDIGGSGSLPPILRNVSGSNEDQPLSPLNDRPIKLPYQQQAASSSGQRFPLKPRNTSVQVSYEQLIAKRSETERGKAIKSYYGIEIHKLLEKAAKSSDTPLRTEGFDKRVQPSVERPLAPGTDRKGRTLLWTEKYRAKKFTDLVGDERTHREVLRWVKRWDPVVFPGSSKIIPKSKTADNVAEERPHRKILLLTGPPGLGKTTLAHVCARQAGYEIVEINASDERSRDIVKGKIRDIVATENVRGVNTKTSGGNVRRAGRPVCVVVDEVDGVVGGGGGGGEGGFIKALIDLVALDQKNTESGKGSDHSVKRKKKGDKFRLLRPMILICNDVYHPALRPLRSAGIAEITHVRKPPMDHAVSRLKSVFEKEGIPCDSDGVRRLCEATWGVSNRRESRVNTSGTGEGDIRGLLVVGEWVASRIRAHDRTSAMKSSRLTRHWIQKHILPDLSSKGSATRNIGRGSSKEIVERVFKENAGFSKEPDALLTEESLAEAGSASFGVSEAGKRVATERLRDLVETSGEFDRIAMDCFAAYASQPFQDDTLLSKPTAAYDWLYFHDSLSARVFSGQEWELSPYLSQSAIGFHHLFASPSKHGWAADQLEDEEKDIVPFTGPRADYEAAETQKQNKTILQAFQSSLSIPLFRSFRSLEDVVTGLLPNLIRILTPDVRPVIVGGSGENRGIVSVRKKGEREMIDRAVRVMGDVGIAFERCRVEMTHGGGSNYVYRMEP